MDKTYILDILNSRGYIITTLLPENAPDYNYDGYDYVITTKKEYTISSYLKNKTKDIKPNYTIDSKGHIHVKNGDFYCLYETHNHGFYTGTIKDNEPVINSQCYISERFFENRGFNLYRVYDFQNTGLRYQNFVRIYKNASTKN